MSTGQETYYMRWTLMQKVMLAGWIGILVVVLTATWRLSSLLSTPNQPDSTQWEEWAWNLLLTSAAMLLLVVLAMLLVRRQIVLPIRDLARAANEIAERGLNRTIPVTGSAEIGDLQRAFNELIGDMRAQQTALRQRNHELQASLDEQRQSEERYRRLVELSPDPVLVYSEG